MWKLNIFSKILLIPAFLTLIEKFSYAANEYTKYTEYRTDDVPAATTYSTYAMTTTDSNGFDCANTVYFVAVPSGKTVYSTVKLVGGPMSVPSTVSTYEYMTVGQDGETTTISVYYVYPPFFESTSTEYRTDDVPAATTYSTYAMTTTDSNGFDCANTVYFVAVPFGDSASTLYFSDDVSASDTYSSSVVTDTSVSDSLAVSTVRMARELASNPQSVVNFSAAVLTINVTSSAFSTVTSIITSCSDSVCTPVTHVDVSIVRPTTNGTTSTPTFESINVPTSVPATLASNSTVSFVEITSLGSLIEYSSTTGSATAAGSTLYSGKAYKAQVSLGAFVLGFVALLMI